MTLFREGHDEAFRIIHDRYRQRLFAYTRQMLPSRQDAEDALQDVFVRAYSGLRAHDHQLALRAWLYRVAHNRCVDELRRPPAPAPELMEFVRSPISDPIAQAEQRESLRRLIADVRRLPDQQRSALLMRELSGMTYCELADALGVSVPAVKSLLVRARVGLAQALEARETACSEIREELILAHDRGVRPNGTAKRHLHDCAGCREFRTEIRGVSRQFAALVPAFGPVGLLVNMLGLGGGAGSGAAAGGGAAAVGGAAGTGGMFAATGVLATGASHVATLLAAAVVTAGSAVEIQHTIASPVKHYARHHRSAPTKPASHASAVAQAAAVQSSAVSLPTSYDTAAPVTPEPAVAVPPAPARTAVAHHPRATAPLTSQPAADSGGPSSSDAGGSSTSVVNSPGTTGTSSTGSISATTPTTGTGTAGTTSTPTGTTSSTAPNGPRTATGSTNSTPGTTGTPTQSNTTNQPSGTSSGQSVAVTVNLGSDASGSGAGGAGSGSPGVSR